jgi:hypothetical protein
MAKERWTAKLTNWIGGSSDGWKISDVKHAGKAVAVRDLPERVKQFLEVTPAGSSAAITSASQFATLPAYVKVSTLKKDYMYRVSFLVDKPKKGKAPRAEIAKSNWDTADYYGDANNGGYVNVARKGRTGGWYLTVVIDSDTGGFTHTLSQDEGPYPSEARARLAGADAVREWMYNNKVRGDRKQNARYASLIKQADQVAAPRGR